MGFNFFSKFFNNIDGAVESYIDVMSNNVYDVMIPIISGCIGITIVWMAIKTFIGINTDPWEEFITRVLWMATVTSVAGVGGIYQQDIAPLVLKFPEIISFSFIGDSNTAASSNVLDSIASLGVNKSIEAAEKWQTAKLDYLMWLFVAFAYLVATGYMVVVGGGFIMVSKVMVGILSTLGPLFIYALLFQAARTFFALWLNQIIYYGCMTLFFSVIYGFFMTMFEHYTTNFQWDGGDHMIYSTLAIVFMAVLAHRALKEVPRFAASLSNGFHIESMTAKPKNPFKKDADKK